MISFLCILFKAYTKPRNEPKKPKRTKTIKTSSKLTENETKQAEATQNESKLHTKWPKSEPNWFKTTQTEPKQGNTSQIKIQTNPKLVKMTWNKTQADLKQI